MYFWLIFAGCDFLATGCCGACGTSVTSTPTEWHVSSEKDANAMPSGQVLANEQLSWRQTADTSFSLSKHGKMPKSFPLFKLSKDILSCPKSSQSGWQYQLGGKISKIKVLTCLGAGVEKCTGCFHGHGADGAVNYLRRRIASATITGSTGV